MFFFFTFQVGDQWYMLEVDMIIQTKWNCLTTQSQNNGKKVSEFQKRSKTCALLPALWISDCVPWVNLRASHLSVSLEKFLQNSTNSLNIKAIYKVFNLLMIVKASRLTLSEPIFWTTYNICPLCMGEKHNWNSIKISL